MHKLTSVLFCSNGCSLFSSAQTECMGQFLLGRKIAVTRDKNILRNEGIFVLQFDLSKLFQMTKDFLKPFFLFPCINLGKILDVTMRP